jgi:hypothetical protein
MSQAREVGLVQSLRVFALLFHLAGTCVVSWVRSDSVSASLPFSARDQHQLVDASYLGLLGLGVALLCLRLLLMFGSHHELTAASCVQLFLDTWAAFFLAWTVLDGLVWTSYISVFVFCVLLPLLMEAPGYMRRTLRRSFVQPSHDPLPPDHSDNRSVGLSRTAQAPLGQPRLLYK